MANNDNINDINVSNEKYEMKINNENININEI